MAVEALPSFAPHKLEQREMLRFKDHEFLNVGHVRVTEGELEAQSDSALTFGGRVEFGGTLERTRRPIGSWPGK